MKIRPNHPHRGSSTAAEAVGTWDAWTSAPGPSEEQVHDEHRAALEATLFRCAATPDELVLELEAGLLRIRSADR